MKPRVKLFDGRYHLLYIDANGARVDTPVADIPAALFILHIAYALGNVRVD